jgi:hypothetical protein
MTMKLRKKLPDKAVSARNQASTREWVPSSRDCFAPGPPALGAAGRGRDDSLCGIYGFIDAEAN